MKPSKEILEAIYETLCSRKFHDWHQSGRFCKHIEDSKPSKDDILKDIENMIFPLLANEENEEEIEAIIRIKKIAKFI